MNDIDKARHNFDLAAHACSGVLIALVEMKILSGRTAVGCAERYVAARKALADAKEKQ